MTAHRQFQPATTPWLIQPRKERKRKGEHNDGLYIPSQTATEPVMKAIKSYPLLWLHSKGVGVERADTMAMYVVPLVQRICSSCAIPGSEWKNMSIVATETGQARTFVRITCDFGKVLVYVNYGFSGFVRYQALKVQLLCSSIALWVQKPVLYRRI